MNEYVLPAKRRMFESSFFYKMACIMSILKVIKSNTIKISCKKTTLICPLTTAHPLTMQHGILSVTKECGAN